MARSILGKTGNGSPAGDSKVASGADSQLATQEQHGAQVFEECDPRVPSGFRVLPAEPTHKRPEPCSETGIDRCEQELLKAAL